MEWWVYLLLFFALVFFVTVIYFSFIYPNKLKKNQLAVDRKKRPHKIVLTPEDVRLFLSFKISELNEMKPEPDFEQTGVFGFYVEKKISYGDGFYPIYLAKADPKTIWEDILITKDELVNHDEKFHKVYDYLEKNNFDLDKIRFFIIEDYNIANFDYWTEVLQTDISGFNQK